MITPHQLTICILVAILMDQALAMPLAGKEYHAGEDPSLLSPSQNVEVRFHHPQLLIRNSPLEGTITSPMDDESTEHEIFGRRMDQSSSFSSITSRFRSKDSAGSGLRRAVTGTPAVQKLAHEQESIEHPAGSLFSSNRVINSGITPRKIVGFESNVNRGGAGRNSGIQQLAGRKETFSHNRLIGETPASTHTDPSSPRWLFGASIKDTRKPTELFPSPSTERWSVLGMRSTSTRNSIWTTPSTPTTTSRQTTTTTATTTTTTAPSTTSITTTETPSTTTEENTTIVTVTAEETTSTTTEEPTTTAPTTTIDSTITTETKYEISELNYATDELNYATPKANHGTTLESTINNTETLDPFVTIKLLSTLRPIKEFDSSSIDGQRGIEQSSIDEENEDEDSAVQLLPEMEAEKYLVEEKTPDGHIVGEFGVISRSSGSLIHGVRYVAHGSIDPDLIKEALRTFLSLK